MTTSPVHCNEKRWGGWVCCGAPTWILNAPPVVELLLNFQPCTFWNFFYTVFNLWGYQKKIISQLSSFIWENNFMNKSFLITVFILINFSLAKTNCWLSCNNTW